MKVPLLTQFRETLYQNLDNRADAILELLDALSSNRDARSVVELSLDALKKGHGKKKMALKGRVSERF